MTQPMQTARTYSHFPNGYEGPVVFIVNAWNPGDDSPTVCGLFTNLDDATATANNATGFSKSAIHAYPLGVAL